MDPNNKEILILTKPRKAYRMIPRLISIDDERWEKLRQKAYNEHKSIAAVIREMIDKGE